MDKLYMIVVGLTAFLMVELLFILFMPTLTRWLQKVWEWQRVGKKKEDGDA